MTQIRVTVKNTSETGGTFLTPVYAGFHDGSFDLFNAGEAASPGLEALAEDGTFGTIAAERQALDPDSQGLVIAGAGGPIATQEVTSATLDVNGKSNAYISFGAMILPSNDAFIGTDEAIQLFDEKGRFLGPQKIVFEGSDVYDAGTEVNTELDAAFINQTGPNTGVDENGVVTLHPGFNGSEGNPVGEGDQIILGGTNAFGAAITEEADFTREGAQVAIVHINRVVERDGTDQRDFIFGGRADDLVDAGDGNDFIVTRRGWDEIDAGDGNDFVRAGGGHDVINGGGGDDILSGGHGDDTFIYVQGDGADVILDFNRRGDDQLALSVHGVHDFHDVLDAAREVRGGVELDFGEGDSIFLRRLDISDLSEDDFIITPTDDLLG
ncbi:MAG: spondin domain-containing protein [Pseudomonadota bacterium]